MSTRLERDARKLLKASGLPFSFVAKRKHTEVYIRERRVVSLSHGSGRDLKLLESAIRRATEEDS